MILPLLLALAVPLRAEAPEAVVARVMARAETLVAEQKGKDARDIRDLDRRAENLSTELKPLGWKAVPALAAAAKDLKRPAKVRLLAASFLALTRDPAALPPLADILLDPEQTPFVRSLAAQSLPGLGATDAAAREPLCAVLAQPELPREVLREALIPLTSLGCPEPAAVTRIARAYGARPGEKDQGVVVAALSVLGRSRGAASGQALLDLTAWFPPLGASRAAAIGALYARRAELGNWLAPEALPVIEEALRSESGKPETMLMLIRVAVTLGPETGTSLARLSRHPDPEVLAEAAEALALFKRVEALPALESVVAGAMNDPRFSPKDGRPDPAVSLARLEKAIAVLRLAR